MIPHASSCSVCARPGPAAPHVAYPPKERIGIGPWNRVTNHCDYGLGGTGGDDLASVDEVLTPRTVIMSPRPRLTTQ